MPGSPEKKKRRESAQLNGDLTSPVVEEDGKEALTDIPGAPEPGKRGASKEYMQALTQRRLALGKEDPAKLGGRPKTRFSKAEVTEHALERLEPLALKVLEQQLRSQDERVRQAAAVKILEWKRGKPSQSVKIDGEQIHTIRYETIALSRSALKADVEIEDAVFEEISDGSSA